MPTITFTPLESKVTELAVLKKNALQQAADQASKAAEAQFVADMKLIIDAHPEIPKDAAVNFHVENGVGTATWPDIRPANDVGGAA